MIQALIKSSAHNLHQLNGVLKQTALIQYKAPLSILFESSLGMHVRHILEFYQCLMNAVHSGVVNYDARARNKRIENDLSFAIQTAENIIIDLNNLEANSSLELHCSQELEGAMHKIPTNLYRELSYLIEHTIHHMAMIKMAYDHNFDEIEIHSHFGVAYSTIKYQEGVHGKLSAS